jgi:subtilisin family serine protease
VICLFQDSFGVLWNLPSPEEIEEFYGSELDSGFNRENNTWEIIIKYCGDIGILERELGAEVEILSQTFAIITLPAEQIPKLPGYQQVQFAELPVNLFLEVAEGLARTCILPVQDRAGYGLTGKDTLVAIIDSGIDYTHPDFRNEDGSSRIVAFWDQTAASGPPPEGFKSGKEYNDQDLNEALAAINPLQVIPSLDINGHGTAVAGIAAGNGRASRGVNRGVAPEAQIIGVRLGRRGERSFARTTELLRGVAYAVNQAIAKGLPLAINISFGTSHGGHTGHSLFEACLQDIAGSWKTAVVVASGNEGASGHHYAGTITSNAIIDITFFTADAANSFFLTLWKNFVDIWAVELILPNGRSTGIIHYYDKRRTLRMGNLSVLINYSQPRPFGIRQEIFFQVEAREGLIPEGVWTLRLHAGEVVDGKYDIWLPPTESISRQTAFSRPDNDSTITLPATAFRVISVGAYNHRLRTVAPFSGRGIPTDMSNFIKPDLVAPGVNIMAPSKNGGYDSFSGTSFSAPFVAGAAALMMQWGIEEGNDPFLYGQRLKAFLHIGASRFENIDYPNNSWGYGVLCLRRTMDYLVSYNKGGTV